MLFTFGIAFLKARFFRVIETCSLWLRLSDFFFFFLFGRAGLWGTCRDGSYVFFRLVKHFCGIFFTLRCVLHSIYFIGNHKKHKCWDFLFLIYTHVLQESVSFSCMRKSEWLGENEKHRKLQKIPIVHILKITEKMFALKRSYKTLIL